MALAFPVTPRRPFPALRHHSNRQEPLILRFLLSILMGVPKVAIVGRPNVGKSSILNWLANRRLAITDASAGVTRDRLSFLMEHEDRFFEIIDTGGMGIEDVDQLTSQIEEQIQLAIEQAAVVVFVVDAHDGIVPLDQEVARRLRYTKVPIICAANKTDSVELEPQADEFYRLGRGKLVRCSTLANRGRDELLDMIVSKLPDSVDESSPDDPVMKLAIVGRRNTGKSTFVNSLAKAERMIVSEVPGTTRDSVDVRFELDGKSFVAIDTPGLKRRGSISGNVDYYSMHRAKRSVRRADVSFLFFDASQPISKVDKQLANYIAEQYKPCIFVVNKWDLYAGSVATEKWANYLRDTFRTMWHVPIAFVTGLTGKNVKALTNHGQMLFTQSRSRIATGPLNRLVRWALEQTPPPRAQHRRPRIYFATQVSSEPPTIVLFCNNPSSFDATYRRYLLGVFRDQLDFGEVPIKLYLRRREQSDPNAKGLDEVDPQLLEVEDYAPET